MQTSLVDAALALSMFEDHRRSDNAPSDHQKEWEEDHARREQVRGELACASPELSEGGDQFAAIRRLDDLVRFEVQRRAWRDGRVPSSYRMRPAFIHAKSCLYALDTIGKSFKLLSAHVDDASKIDALIDEWNESMPDLMHVRNSAHHPEDRVQGKTFSRRIDLQPVENEMLSVPGGGALIVDWLANDRYGGTLADGRFGEIEISPATVAVAARVVQAAHDLFQWRGPRSLLPL
ncbi:MAG: hypothetical protein JWM49_886 [Microbacteriaceae bacterium]|nr:hypothetical protein [Microbacteriaceae bacterium]